MQSEARYRYDCLGRRIGKEVTRNSQTERSTFLWQGLRLLQEQQPQLRSLYLYEPDSYAPLARIDSDPEQPERPGKWLPLVPWMERVRERWLACLNI
ncbi:hypothetical protein DMX11_11740 [Pseudomonas sp. LB-090624]|uniref:hypothetical protein n=1 Tax=Pseudomonas sp. LB-090624 TaxID=2213079 RepID=UPI000D878DFA|nr:hypothetical protein [Pseudomonas sp. LB-090624]PYB76320.1 hypothetical protein DMX11_11740 [Pseudomonas sp. LB-090624]